MKYTPNKSNILNPNMEGFEDDKWLKTEKKLEATLVTPRNWT